MSGHYFAATSVPWDKTIFHSKDGLAWRDSSTRSKRGFCNLCGSFLFFNHGEGEPLSVSSGSLDNTDELRLAAHIFIDEAGDYYQLDGDVPTFTAQEWRDQKGWKKYRHQPVQNQDC